MIIPLPVQAEILSGFFNIDEKTVIAAAGEASTTAAYLAGELRSRTGLSPRMVADGAAAPAISLHLDKSRCHLGDEGYTFEVTGSGTTILAAKPAGLFYGVQSLLQLLDQQLATGRGNRVPCVRVEDRPRYSWRGFMLDSSRHIQTVETVKRILDQMAYIKLNTLHWHLTDDQGWRIEIRRYPKLTEFGSKRPDHEPGGNGFYTQEQLRDIVAYAGDRHIAIMPEIEMPAHTSAAMACYPELTCSGEHEITGGIGLRHFVSRSDGTGAIYCAAREETYEFIEGVLTEVMDIFPSPVIHLGGDERPDGIWEKCPHCSALMMKEGLKTEMALQAHFMRRVTDFVNQHGRRTMAWTTTTEFGIPDDQIAEDWFYGTLGDAVKLGHDGISARDQYTYLDYPNFPGRQKPEWMSDLWVDKMYEFNPTPDGLTPEEAKHVLGATSSLWTEFIEEEDLSEAMFPRLLGFAEVVWTPKDRRVYSDFEGRMNALEAPLKRLGITYAVPPGTNPVTLARPGSVTTSMEVDPIYPPECAFDGKLVRSFLSKSAPKAGDHLTVTLETATPVKRIFVHSGTDFLSGTEITDGAVEISSDGTLFREVAPTMGRETLVVLSGEAVKAVRITVKKDMDHRLGITEIVLQ